MNNPIDKLKSKLKRTSDLIIILVDEKDAITHARTDRYYKVLYMYQAIKKEIYSLRVISEVNNILDDSIKREFNRAVRENMVTTSTHNRWKKAKQLEIRNYLKKM